LTTGRAGSPAAGSPANKVGLASPASVGTTASKPEARAFAAAAQSAAVVPTTQQVTVNVSVPGTPGMQSSEPKDVIMAATPVSSAPVRESVAQSAVPEFVLSAGLEASQSWISSNKYVIAALLVVAAVVGAFFLLR
jgi:hypothetical protein